MKNISISIMFLLLGFKIYAQENDTCRSCKCYKINSHFWEVLASEDADGRFFLVRGDSVSFYCSKLENIIRAVNGRDLVKVKLLKVKKSIPYVKIINSSFFTQQLGGYDALAFLARLVFDITEIRHIDKVHIDFIEGDHTVAQGFYTRGYFNDIYNVCGKK